MPLEFNDAKASTRQLLSADDFASSIDSYTASEEVGAAFVSENILAGAISRYSDPIPEGDAIEGFNQYDLIKDEHIDYWDAYEGVENEEQFRWAESRVDNELRRREILDTSGGSAIGYQILAGILDPVMWPAAAVPLVRGGTVLSKAVSTGAAAMGEAAVAETFLQQQQVARTPIESALAIGGAGILGGMLGGAIGGLTSREVLELANKVSDDLNNAAEGGLRTIEEAKEFDSAGAMAAPTWIQPLKTGGTAFMSPLLRGLSSASNTMRTFTDRMFMHNLQLYDEAGRPFVATSEPAQMKIVHNLRTRVGDINRSQKSWWKQARKNGYGGSRAEFEEEVGRAMATTSGSHRHVEVLKAALEVRRHIDDITDLQKKAGLLPEDVKVRYAEIYRPRKYDVKRIQADEQGFMDFLMKKFRENGDMSGDDFAELSDLRLRADSGEPLGDEAVSRMESLEEKLFRELDDSELEALATNTMNSIYGTQRGQISLFDDIEDIAGSTHLRERLLAISDEDLMSGGADGRGYLVNNASELMESWLNSVVPELSIRQTFDGDDLSLAGIREDITAEYSRLRKAAKTSKERAKLRKQEGKDLDDVENVIRHTLGRFGPTNTNVSDAANINSLVRGSIFMAQLGMMTVSALPDLARPIMEHGLRNWLRALPFNMRTSLHAAMGSFANDVNVRNLQKIGIATDLLTHSRIWAMNPEMASMGKRMRKATELFSLSTGMTTWNTMMKTTAANIAGDAIIRAAMRPSAKSLQKLAKYGISTDDAIRIAELVKAGKVHQEKGLGGSLYVPGTKNWGKANGDLVRKVQNAMLRDADTTIVTPGVGDRPLFIGTELGKYLFQFKSFALTAHNQMTIPIAQKLAKTLNPKEFAQNMEVVNGIAASLLLGYLSVYTRHKLGGTEELIEDQSDLWWLREAMDKSGMLSVPIEVAGALDVVSGGQVSETFSDVTGIDMSIGARRFQRSPLGALAGPAVGYGERAAKSLFAFMDGQITQSELHSARMMLPWQNHVATKALLTQGEEAIGDYYNLQKKSR